MSEASGCSAIRALLHGMSRLHPQKAASTSGMLALQDRNFYQLRKSCQGLLRCYFEPAFSQPQLYKVFSERVC